MVVVIWSDFSVVTAQKIANVGKVFSVIFTHANLDELMYHHDHNKTIDITVISYNQIRISPQAAHAQAVSDDHLA